MSATRRWSLPLLVAGIVGFGVFLWVTLRVDPLTAVRFRLSRQEILDLAARIAAPYLPRGVEYESKAHLVCNRDLLSYLQRTFGARGAHELAAEGIPVFRWRVKWSKKGESFPVDSRAPDEKTLEIVRSSLIGALSLELDTQGNLISLMRGPGSADTGGVSLDSSRALAEAADFLRTAARLPESLLQKLVARSATSGQSAFVFVVNDTLRGLGVGVTHVVVVGRGGIRSYRREIRIPAVVQPGGMRPSSVFELLGLIGLGLLGLVLFVRRLRADQLDLVQGAPLAALAAIAVGFVAYAQMDSPLLYSVVALLFVIPAVGFVVLALYALSDSVGHDVWAEKAKPLAGLLRGVVLTQPIGESLLRAFLWAGVAGGLLRFVDYLYLNYGGAVLLADSRLPFYSSSYGAVLAVAAALSGALIQELAMRTFLISYLRRFVSGISVLLLLGFVVGSFDFVGVNLGQLEPDGLQISRVGLYGAVMTAALVHGDFLVPIVAGWLLRVVYRGVGFAASGLDVSATLVFLAVGALFLLAVAALVRGGAGEVLERIEPAYLKRLAERERLHRELEIARHVQQTFLPSDLPAFPGLDLASRCSPATEVGGDYYDLIPLDERRLGVVIGDVSGKGIGAAFYMTLTKGFLRAYTRQFASPREVLSRVNQLFYENAERGRFISMIYAVFDMGTGTLSFARAGHNPLLLRRREDGQVRTVAPPGLALGLARSDLFDRVTSEEAVRFSKGDVFVFYTDGFTEAMTLQEVEFGEGRLAEALAEVGPDWSAEQILGHLFASVEEFVGSGEQHDDMTLVVVKIA